MKTFLIVLTTSLLAASATWFALRNAAPVHTPAATAQHQALFYQCAMHPWIKSDKPGRCTICGMELTPVYENDKGADDSSGGKVVTLTQNQIQVLHVQTVEAKTRPLVRTLRVAGTLSENLTRHRVLAAYLNGRIDKLHVNYLGAEVTAGQPLAEFYSPALLQAEREYRQLTGDLRNNTALRLRQMGLAPAQIDAIDRKPADALTSQILSPVGGTVVMQSVYEGQYVATGEKLFEIADFSTMWFLFRAYEQDMPWLKTGQSVRITTPSLPDKTFTGKITFIDPNFDEATRSTNVRVELPNPLVKGQREILSRLYADGMVELDAPPVLTVPRPAVIETGPEAVAYVDREGGAYERRALKTGRRGDVLVEVLSGLAEGDRVVTNGNLLIDGQAEMNRAFMVADEAAAPTKSNIVLDEAARKSIGDFLKVADAMAAALASDDLAAFNTAGGTAMDVTGKMLETLRPQVKNLDALDGARHFHGINDLKAARAAFHKFTMAATAVMEPLRKAGQTPEFQLYECGMADQAIPGIPKQARWIQTGGREMHNPFFGKAMPDCGEEINR